MKIRENSARGRNEQLLGIADAAISSSSFGFSPFFSVSLLAAGLSAPEVLTYRWGFATAALFIFAMFQRRSLRMQKGELPKIFLLSIFRALTSIFLLVGYANIASGAASTIHFMYPIVVAVCMMSFFGEKKSPVIIAAVILSLAGTALLAGGEYSSEDGMGKNVPLGITTSVCSVFCYSAYMLLLKKTGADRIESTRLTFYVMGFSALYFLAASMVSGGVSPVTEPKLWFHILGISVLSTTVSNFFLVKAVKRAGPTLASVFGVLEPLTAVIIGAVFLSEKLTPASIAGILLILVTVTAVVVNQKRTQTVPEDGRN